MLLTCISTVRGLKNSSLAISRLVGPASGNHPQDLQFPTRQAAVVQLSGASLAQPSFSSLPQRTEGPGELLGQGLRAEAASCPVRSEEMLDCLVATAGRDKHARQPPL